MVLLSHNTVKDLSHFKVITEADPGHGYTLNPGISDPVKEEEGNFFEYLVTHPNCSLTG
jgi:hypothetical protein